MVRTIQVDGREFRVSGNPDMGTVKYVQQMEIEMMRQYLDDQTLLEMDQVEDDELMSQLLEDADIDDFKQMMWDRSVQEPIQTICLATNEKLETADTDEMKALDFKKLLEASREALNGSASDFMDELGIDISSKVNQMEEMEEVQDWDDSSQETPPAVSEVSRKQSRDAGQTEPTTSTK